MHLLKAHKMTQKGHIIMENSFPISFCLLGLWSMPCNLLPFYKAKTCLRINWNPKLEVQYCYLRLYLGIESRYCFRSSVAADGKDGRWIKGAVSRQSSSFCLILLIPSPHVNDKIRDSRRTNVSPEHYFWRLQTAEINFEKLLGWTVFKKPNFNPFRSSSVLPIRGICCICCII